MPKALQHSSPRWTEPFPPQPYPYDEPAREVIDGHIRIVHAKRARLLRKRGVPLIPAGRGVYAWYETPESFETRAKQREKKRAWLALRRRFDRGAHIALPPDRFLRYMLASFRPLRSYQLPLGMLELDFETIEACTAMDELRNHNLSAFGYHIDVKPPTPEDRKAKAVDDLDVEIDK